MTTQAAALAEKVEAIEAELDRLGWLCTNDRPCYYCVDAAADLPAGWVRIYDDNADTFGPAEEVLAALRALPVGTEYGVPDLNPDPRKDWRDWPAETFRADPTGMLVAVRRNDGVRYACGCEGENSDTLAEAYQYDLWYTTPQEAVDCALGALEEVDYDPETGECLWSLPEPVELFEPGEVARDAE